MISGECGAGKTVAARARSRAWTRPGTRCSTSARPGVGLRGIYGLIVTALGGTPRFHHAALIPQAQELLAAEAAERGKQVVLIIDEAHLLDAESLEGDPLPVEHGDGPDRPVLPAAARPADAAPPAAARHVHRAGSADRGPLRDRRPGRQGDDQLRAPTTSRSPAAPTPCSPTTRSALIHEVSRGLPRQVNNLAVASLIAAFAAKKAIVDESAARAAVAEISAE